MASESKLPPLLATALDIQEAILPIVALARRQGWTINMAIEWRDGERFTVSGNLPAKGSE